MYKRRVTQDGVTVMNKELYDNLQDGIDELKNSQFLEMSGEEIVCDSSKKGGLFLSKVFGKSKQRTTTGAQLAKFKDEEIVRNGVTITFKDGVCTFSGNPTIESGMIFTIMSEPINLELLNVGTTYYATDAIIRYMKNDVVEYGTSFVYDESIAEVKIYVQRNLPDYKNNEVLYPRLTTTENVNVIEPYTGGKPSPNPDFPQAVENCENTEVSVYGGNLIPFATTGNTITNRGISAVFNEDGLILNGRATVDYAVLFIANVYLAPGEYYINDDTNNQKAIYSQVQMSGADGKTKYISNSSFTVDGTEGIVTVSVQTGLLENAETFTNYHTCPMLVKGNKKPNKYEPYKEKQSLILNNTLCGIPVSSGGNYTDDNGQEWVCDEVDMERGVYVQRIGKIHANNSFKLSQGHTVEDTELFYITYSGINENTRELSLCNKLKYDSELINNYNDGFYYAGGNFFARVKGVRDVNTVNQLIGDAVFISVLSTPIETPLTAEQIAAYYSLKSHDRFTRISNDKNLGISAKIPTTDAAGLLGLSLQDSFFNSVFTSTERELKDTKKGGLRFNKIFGKSKQESVNGYQLFDASKLPTKTQGGATVTNNGDGSFTVSGSGNVSTFAANYDLTHGQTINLFKAGTINLANKKGLYPYFYVEAVFNDGATFASIIEQGSMNITQEFLDNPTSFIRIGFYAQNREINTGTIKPMLYQDGDGTWEEFTGGKASPSPEYPQEIVSCENTEVSVYGKNLLENKAESKTINGVTFTVNDDKTVTLNGEATEVTTLTLSSNPLPKGDYILSGCPKGGEWNTYSLQHNYNKQEVGNGLSISSDGNVSGNHHIRIAVYKGTKLSNVVFKPMIRLASVKDDTYEPYKKQSLTIPNTLCGIPVTDASIANYTDENGQMWVCDEVDFERGVYVQRTILKSFSKVNVFLTTDKTYFYCDVSELVHTQSFYCNVAKHETNTMKYGNVWKADSRLIIGNADANGSPVLSSVDELFSNIDMFEILGILDEPIETPLDKATLGQFLSAKTNEGVTIIHTNSVIEPEISVSYGKSEVTAKSLLAENLERNSIKYGDIVDNLLSDATNLPVSARVVKELKKGLTGEVDIFGSSSVINNCDDAEIGSVHFVYPSALNTPFNWTNSVMYTHGTANAKIQLANAGSNIKTRYYAQGEWSQWFGYRRIQVLNATMTTNETGDIKPAIPSGAELLSIRADGMMCFPLYFDREWYARCFDGSLKAASNQTRSFFFVYADVV